MKGSVYIETSVASYLTSRPSRDLVVAANQQLTLEWWNGHRHRFDLYVSDIVLVEAAQGDPLAAARRLAELEGIPSLPIDQVSQDLASSLVHRAIVPAKAMEDALHIAIAANQGMDFLLTWNCRHIASAEVTAKLRVLFEAEGFRIPTICTPAQLMGD
ncbi:MAG: type II toxin-antitoxin system VapC family toxin [Acidobacteria bacterium]|nr:type II toxin-antitoxin system VapC family toxin [Acidobacteriota bacterium]